MDETFEEITSFEWSRGNGSRWLKDHRESC